MIAPDDDLAHPAIADGGPCDPDRAWDWRDSGGGDEDADDEGPDPRIGPIDTEYSFARASAHFPCLVTPIFSQRARA